MGNKLKPKEVNEVLEELTNAVVELNNNMSNFQTPTASNVTYDNTTSGLTADDVQDAIDEVLSSLGSKLLCDGIVQVLVKYNTQTNNFIIAGLTNVTTQDGIHIYFSTTNTKKITVYKRENGVTTELYSFT